MIHIRFGSLVIIDSHFELVVNLCQFLLSLDFCFLFSLVLKHGNYHLRHDSEVMTHKLWPIYSILTALTFS